MQMTTKHANSNCKLLILGAMGLLGASHPPIRWWSRQCLSLAQHRALSFLSGKVVSIRQDGVRSNTILDYRNSLPVGLQPILVLDASGRVRSTYDQWEQHRGGLVRLPSATKRYDQLTVHVWQRGGGKSSFRRNGQELVQGIANTINTKPTEEWLVVHHKAGIGMDFENEVRRLLSVDDAKVHFINWGCHDATNRFSHVGNVILAGTLFYRPSYYESLGRLASDHPSSDGPYPVERFNEVMLGEHRHLILQALCRGAVRRCEDDVCSPCDAFVIASVGSKIPKTIPALFPGCRLSPWKPLPQKLTGRAGEALEFITAWFEGNPGDTLPVKDVYEALGMDKSSFRKGVRRNPRFIEALAEVGIEENNESSRRAVLVKGHAP